MALGVAELSGALGTPAGLRPAHGRIVQPGAAQEAPRSRDEGHDPPQNPVHRPQHSAQGLDRMRNTIGCAVLTVSDSRTVETDTSGALAEARLGALGHRCVARVVVPDEVDAIVDQLSRWRDDPEVDVVVTTGGTGLTARDVTPDAVARLGTKRIEGFGELFRWLSYTDIGSSTVQSRADAWVCGRVLVFVLPGSTGAVRLAFDRILDEQLDATHRPCNFVALLPRIRGEAP
jgi:molybdenum cofactor biosynthesis protein B